MAYKAQAMRDFTIGFGGASAFTWLGAAGICGFWKFGRSLDSCIEHILSLEGSRMQRELANIMLKKYHHDPWVMQRVSKHFYSEEVYDDSSVDQPKFRWRVRNNFADGISQITSKSEEIDLEKIQKTSREPQKNYATKSVEDRALVKTSTSGDVMENPFDCIFGDSASIEEICHPDTSSTLSRRQRHLQRRTHRRHRKLQQEDSDI